VHANNLALRVCGCELSAIVDENQEAARKLAEEVGARKFYGSLSEAFKKEEIDAVFITTPTFTHANLAVEAAEAGKHVFCEKPMALNLREADEMISATKRHNVKLQIGFMRRFDPEFKRARELIERGEIGKPVLIKSVGRGPGLPPRWACNPKTSIGMLAEVNSHDFDSIRWFMKSEISSVYAEAEALICRELAGEFPGFYDVAVVSLRLSNGGLGVIDGGCPVGYGYDARVEVLGTEGLISVGEIPGSSLLLCRKEKVVARETFQSWRDRFRSAYLAEVEHFVSCILNDSEPSVTGTDGRKALEAVLAAIESIERREVVYLPNG
jgi:myo-inositol 2-dehydrogenase/D-chiro-inositol 1-dehydrogenase/scyllo-inositol 2-dehydrogenase (NAD+)